MRSATSVGANAEEAQAGQSRADFISKNAICLKEARESHYWLLLLQAAEVSDDRELPALEQESLELARIFGSIITSAKRNSVR
jgi:four helix bundle protein